MNNKYYRRGYDDFERGVRFNRNPYVEHHYETDFDYHLSKHDYWNSGWSAAEHNAMQAKRSRKEKTLRGILAKDLEVGKTYKCIYTDWEGDDLRSGDIVKCLRSHIVFYCKVILNTRTQEVDSCTYDKVRFELSKGVSQ